MISVCIATYNGEKYIKEQLNSILSQIGAQDEVIVSDDGSKDETIAILESFNDSRIVIFRNCFRDVVKNFEFAISKAKGDIIFLSDQDDIWGRTKVAEYKNLFLNNPKTDLVLSDLQLIDKDGKLLKKSFYNKLFTTSLLKNLIQNNFIGCSMAFKKEIKDNILPFPNHIAMHDWWIGVCCIVFGNIAFIDKKLIYYRRHDNNVTKEGGAGFVTKCIWRINLIFNLMIRIIKISR